MRLSINAVSTTADRLFVAFNNRMAGLYWAKILELTSHIRDHAPFIIFFHKFKS